MSIVIIFAFLAIFVQLKTLEYREHPSGVHTIFSIASWILAAIAVILAVVAP